MTPSAEAESITSRGPGTLAQTEATGIVSPSPGEGSLGASGPPQTTTTSPPGRGGTSSTGQTPAATAKTAEQTHGPTTATLRTSTDPRPAAPGDLPAAFKAITLPGTFAPLDAYTIATGALADVPGPSSTVALAGLEMPANAAQPTKGMVYFGDSTWYAAGEGGYGSCGEKL